MSELDYTRDGHVGRVTINRPHRRNALTTDVLTRFRSALDDARRDEGVRVVVVSGAGDEAFCAGADLSSMASSGPMEAHDDRSELAGLFRDLWGLGKPTIARVHGFALAGGFGLAMACDFVIASEDAQFGTPEIKVGLWPYMITVPLLRSMSLRLAFELMATGRRVSAAEAERAGMVNRVVPAAKLDEAVDELVASLAAASPLLLRLGRQSFLQASTMHPDAALEYLHAMLTVTSASDDTREGIAAFVDKRAPNWHGR